MIKRIFSDMDGTLLDNTGAVSEENVSLIKSAGIPMTLVSARAPMEMMAAIKKLDLTGAQVSFNGGLIYLVEGGRILPIHSQPIAKEMFILFLARFMRNFQRSVCHTMICINGIVMRLTKEFSLSRSLRNKSRHEQCCSAIS